MKNLVVKGIFFVSFFSYVCAAERPKKIAISRLPAKRHSSDKVYISPRDKVEPSPRHKPTRAPELSNPPVPQ